MNCLKPCEHYLIFKMNYIIKAAALCTVCVLLSLIIKKSNPEFALLIGVACVIGCCFTILDLCTLIREQMQAIMILSEPHKSYCMILLKCCGINVISHLSAGICKDAGQSAAGSSIELIGALCCIGCLIPLFKALFTAVEDIL